ncbi:hypothetical protein E1283_04645 [Streptomyces hainanensis]|uniref:Uncharacterized protein n=1 Tax=Streptomyces hainanensis TaxID=402648 RepID=A0A4R4TKW1_9ACTN|nr:hypothetical protein E1283_04645 [Streptomyces hainanensis]
MGALADVLGVSADAVDFVDSGVEEEFAGRDWTAPVLCTQYALSGDLATRLDIQLQGPVDPTFGEGELATALARRLNTILFWDAQEGAPSTNRLVTPDGLVTRARVTETDGPAPTYTVTYTVDAVEAPVPRFPMARVQLLPEIYWEERIATPVADVFVAATAPDRGSRADHPLNRAGECLVLWERLVRRMAGDWAPTGRYPAESYLRDLRTRDHLAACHTALAAPGPRDSLAAAVEELDEVFGTHTTDDGGFLVLSLGRAGPEVTGDAWWWRRRPVRVPWPDGPVPEGESPGAADGRPGRGDAPPGATPGSA